MISISVIVCTYNPVEAIFSRCLTAIESAAMGYAPLEIILVDNNSYFPVADNEYVKKFLQQNSSSKVVVELRQGLTPARLRGIAEARGNVLLFIDDDNFVNVDFFATGAKLASNYPYIGAWSGQVKLIFEEEPEAWTRKYWGLLVCREFTTNLWSNLPHLPETMPCGAGLFIRKDVADYYFKLHKQGKREFQLDRNKESLLSGGDNDLAACACDIGLGVGLFHELLLEHYIPKKRLTKKYLLELAEGIAASTIVFRSFRNEFPQQLSLRNKVANSFRLILKKEMDRKFYQAILRGEKSGKTILSNYQHEFHQKEN